MISDCMVYIEKFRVWVCKCACHLQAKIKKDKDTVTIV